MFKKTTMLVLISACALISQNAFAWVQADNRTKICNMTNSTTFNFYKSHSYQANTNNDHSANFSIAPQECAYIDFWMQYKEKQFDLDDALTFTENSSPSKGWFDIQNTDYISSLFPDLSNFNLNGYVVSHWRGRWSSFAMEEGYIEISDPQ